MDSNYQELREAIAKDMEVMLERHHNQIASMVEREHNKMKGLVIEVLEQCQHLLVIHSTPEQLKGMTAINSRLISLATRISEESRMRGAVGDKHLADKLRSLANAVIDTAVPVTSLAQQHQPLPPIEPFTPPPPPSAPLTPQQMLPARYGWHDTERIKGHALAERVLKDLEQAQLFSPVKIIPKTPEVKDLEMACCEWFYHYREDLTGEPNIKTRQGLLAHVYGVNEGRATTQYQGRLGSNLGYRVTQIISVLKKQ